MPIQIRRLPRFLPVLALFALAAPQYGAAQGGLASLAPGAHVRVTATSLGPEARPARVVSASADTLVVLPDDAKWFVVTVPRPEITHLDISTGKSTRRARFALIGFGAGAVIGWFAGAATYEDPCKKEPAGCSGWFYQTRGTDALGGALAGSLYGAAAGAITGQLWKTDRWQPYRLGARGAAIRIVPAPSRGHAVALALTMPMP